MAQQERSPKNQKPVISGVPRALFEQRRAFRLPVLPRRPRFEYICRKQQQLTIVSPYLRVWA